MKERNGKGLHHSAILGAARAASRLSIKLVADYRLEHGVELPEPSIFIAPHRSMFDVPLGIETFHRLEVSPLLVVSQKHLEGLRVPASSNWDALDLLPITRDSEGRSNLLAAGAAALAAGRSVAVMPEGRIVRGSEPRGGVRSGAAELAVRTTTPVVVIGSAGADRFWLRGRPATFANVKRQPAVVVVHEVLRPDGDVGTTRSRIAASLVAAEARARVRLDSLLKR
jgi:1-acyl-sn-glycerol-3-phosphate acyltransferase